MTHSDRLDNEAKKLIAELGSKYINSLGFRDNWLFVGAKGASKKDLFEKVTAQTQEFNVLGFFYSSLFIHHSYIRLMLKGLDC